MLSNRAMTKLITSVGDDYEVDYADFFRRDIGPRHEAKPLRNGVIFVLFKEFNFSLQSLAKYFDLDPGNLSRQITAMQAKIDYPPTEGQHPPYRAIVNTIRGFVSEIPELNGEYYGQTEE